MNADRPSARLFEDVNLKDDSSVLAFILAMMKEKELVHGPAMQQANLNETWYGGDQDWFKSPGGLGLEKPPNYEGRVRVQFNMLGSLADAWVAGLGAPSIIWEVAPQNDSGDAEDTAEMRSLALRWAHQNNGLRTIIGDADSQFLLNGNFFIKVTWNPKRGGGFEVKRKEVGDDDRFDRLFGDEAKNGVLQHGDLDFGVIPMANIFWHPHTEPLRTAQVAFVIYERTVGYMRARFGKKVTADTGDNTEDMSAFWKPRDSTDPLSRIRQTQDTKTVTSIELWAPRSAQHPRGVFIHATRNKVLSKRHNPYEHGMIPVVQARLRVITGQGLGVTHFSDAIQPQAVLNRLMSQQVEGMELTAAASWLIHKGAIVDDSEWDGAVGGKKQWKGEKIPVLTQGKTFPASSLVLIDQVIQRIQDVLGIHDVTLGRSNPSLKSGRAILALGEADRRRSARARERREEAQAQLGWLTLATMHQFLDRKRVLSFKNDDDIWTHRTFKGVSLSGTRRLDLNVHDVKVRTDAPTDSRAADIDLIDSLVRQKWFRNDRPDDRKIVLDTLRLGSPKHRLDPKRFDRLLARRHCEAMFKDGQYIPALLQYDHATHQQTITEFIKRHDAELRKKPKVYKLLNRRYLEHEHFKAFVALIPQIVAQRTAANAQNAENVPPRGGLLPPKPNGANRSFSLTGPQA